MASSECPDNFKVRMLLFVFTAVGSNVPSVNVARFCVAISTLLACEKVSRCGLRILGAFESTVSLGQLRYRYLARLISLRHPPQAVTVHTSAARRKKRFALVLGSKIHSPFAVFNAGMLDTAGLMSINRRVLVHQPLLPGRSRRSFWELSFVYSMNCLNMPALHASAASRSFGVPSAACLASTRSSTSSVSHGCVDFFSWIIFCGMQS